MVFSFFGFEFIEYRELVGGLVFGSVGLGIR